MNSDENPYDILGVDSAATSQQIKVAYRKLALLHHPDKQTTDAARRAATERFSKISNAYEILGNETSRAEFDNDAKQQQQQQQQQQTYHQQQHQQQHFQGHAFHPFHRHVFHDPFQVFAQVFRDDFGNQQQQQRSSNAFGSFAGFSMFDRDPFFQLGFGGSMFQDPFQQQQRQQQQQEEDYFNDPFFGGSNNMFASMQRQMMQQQQQMMMMQLQQQQPQYHGGGGGGSSFFSSSSSSSSSTSMRMGPDGSREQVTKTTRIVNGQQQTTIETVKTKPNGSVERNVETIGSLDPPQQQQPRLEQQQQQRLEQRNTWSSR